ncbi:hypothetical protein AXK61_00275 [Tsukamurella pseudospumae]|uniref:TnsA endonuclease N-terminal domain-containing protein n=2 Tax=Tsukamurella pseudospumae TaxID=239498 RepID=A0A137ZSZ7_9ACTN|nr:hypothetical protein AXK61_00275 [Tsukamurella pseudospumae]
MGAQIAFESWVERDWLMVFDQAADVVEIVSQPFELSIIADGRRVSHTPDFLVRQYGGGLLVVDVRPDERVDQHSAAVFAATATCCADVGWDYQRVGTVDEIVAANLRWLAGYRLPRCRDENVAATAIAQLANGPMPIRVLARCLGAQMAVLPTVFHLIWIGAITAATVDQQVLDLDSVVSAAGGDRT